MSSSRGFGALFREYLENKTSGCCARRPCTVAAYPQVLLAAFDWHRKDCPCRHSQGQAERLRCTLDEEKHRNALRLQEPRQGGYEEQISPEL